MGGGILTRAGGTMEGSGVAAIWVWFSIQVMFYYGTFCWWLHSS